MSSYKYACAFVSLSKIIQYPTFYLHFEFFIWAQTEYLLSFSIINQIFFLSQNIVIGREARAETQIHTLLTPSLTPQDPWLATLQHCPYYVKLLCHADEHIFTSALPHVFTQTASLEVERRRRRRRRRWHREERSGEDRWRGQMKFAWCIRKGHKSHFDCQTKELKNTSDRKRGASD